MANEYLYLENTLKVNNQNSHIVLASLLYLSPIEFRGLIFDELGGNGH